MKKVYYFIYVTTNLVNGKQYVGQHCTYDLNDEYLGSNVDLKKDINLFGIQNFERKVIEYCNDIYHLAKRELHWIVQFNAVENENWYNRDYKCSPNVFFGKKHSRISKEKMSEKRRLVDPKKYSIKHKESYPKMGHRKGVKLTDEHKIKIGVASTGPRNGFFGKTHSQEQIEKWKKERKGKKQPKEVINKRVEKNKGQKRTEEQKARIRQGLKMAWERRKQALNI